MTTSEAPLGETQQPPPSPQPAPSAAKGFALAALIVGIVAFLFGLIPVFGALVGIAAVVLGVLAVSKNQSKGMAIAGIVLGAVAILSSIGMTAGIGAIVNSASDREPTAVSQTADPEAEVVPAPEAIDEAEVEAPAIPVEFASALIKAESYSEIMSMSKVGIYDQLVSEYGEKFSPEAAQYAVDTIQADWNANALEKAKSYQETMAMSPEAIRDQLQSPYGEKFTPAEADYAVLHLND